MQYNITTDQDSTPYKNPINYVLRREATTETGELVTTPTYLGRGNWLADDANSSVVRRYLSRETAQRQGDKLHFAAWKREKFGWPKGYYESYVAVPVYLVD